MIRTAVVLAVALALALPGCGVRQRLGFGPSVPASELPFDAKLSDGEDPRDFTVLVEAGGNGLEATRESVRFPATAHCLRTVGKTEIAWRLDETGDWAGLPQGNGEVLYAGRCIGR